MAVIAEAGVPSANMHLSRWRVNSPFVQAFLVNMVVFCCQGMLSTILGLGAGGGRPSNIQLVDRVYTVTSVVSIVAGFVGGSINNQIGPRWSCVIGASGFPLYVGAMWVFLEEYVTLIHHAGYVITSYSTESTRGQYIATFGVFDSLGATTGAGAIALGITTTPSSKLMSHVPSAVYITIICVQSCGIIFAVFLADPSRVRRNDGRAIAVFTEAKWVDELRALPKTLCTTKTLLLALALFNCQMTYSLLPALNAFYFNARTRALINFSMIISGFLGCAMQAFFCDAQCLGNRRRRALIAGAVNTTLMVGPWAGLFSFLATHNVNRMKLPPGVDWTEGSSFSSLLVVFITLNWSLPFSIGYLQWLCSSFSNEPAVLGRLTAYVLTLKNLGLTTAHGTDSHGTPFLTEAAIYFPMGVVGSILAIISASKYTMDSKYGEEETVIVPEAFEREKDSFTTLSVSETSESKI